MGRRAPIPAAVLLFCLVSLTGLPPTAGFIAKLYIFNAAVQADLVWLVIVAVLNTAISAFYYLGVARQMYLESSEGLPPLLRSPLATEGILVVAAMGVLTFGVYPIPLIEAAQRAVNVFG
jgi:NADH-quinone oxidoreductase subunit N